MGCMGKLEPPTPSVLMFCPDCTSNMTPREGVGDMESKEDREERYQEGQGKAGRKKDACGGGGKRLWWLDLRCSGVSTRAKKGLSLGGGAQLLPAAHGSCSPPARCGAQLHASPPRGAGARSAQLRTRGHPGAHPPCPPASSPSGLEGATGQRSPGSGQGWVGEALFFPALAAPGVPQRPPRLQRHSLLRGCGAVGPGFRGAPGRRGGVQGGLQA